MDRQYSGVSMYAFNLLNALFKIDKDNEYILFYNSFTDFQMLDLFNPFSRISRGFNAERKYKNIALRGSSIPNKIFNASTTFLNFPKMCEQADILIAVSENTKYDIIDLSRN